MTRFSFLATLFAPVLARFRKPKLEAGDFTCTLDLNPPGRTLFNPQRYPLPPWHEQWKAGRIEPFMSEFDKRAMAAFMRIPEESPNFIAGPINPNYARNHATTTRPEKHRTQHQRA